MSFVCEKGIVDYENETALSYRSDWDAFYRYVKDTVEANFSKKQLINKVKNLKRSFTYNQSRSNDGKELSFTDTDDDEIFKLSMIIWAKNETEYVSNEGMDQAKVSVLVLFLPISLLPSQNMMLKIVLLMCNE